VFAEASAETRAQGRKGGQWIYVTHHLAEAPKVLQALHDYCGHDQSNQGAFLGTLSSAKFSQSLTTSFAALYDYCE